MKFLLDTQLVLWAPVSDARLSRAARLILNDPEHQTLFSVASLWEIAIKSGIGKLDPNLDPRSFRRQLIEMGHEELPVLGQHAVSVDGLPPIHKDPFDRLLIAQAMVEGITLLTADATIARYPGPIRKV
ncbi:MAG TPA: type II toxin-antitoxin system VapC family toxin [Terracidiphilus sp.]|jgi:PIN domain nuclease of toxin-antitoxin system|nr:type II toxin-antitoxin system VapC family toxin [Terracidiphilus sp.]